MSQDFDLRRIDLNLLIIFDAIYTAGNITRASQQLGMSQPTVSNALGRLRAQFNDPLFQRAEKGVAPTPFADGLIVPVRQALEILRDTLLINRDFDLANANRTFRLAMNDFTVVGLLPDLLNQIATRASGVRVQVIGQEVMSPMDALLAGEADIAVDTFTKEVPGVNFIPLHIPQGVVAARRSHPMLRGEISKQQFSKLGHVALRQDSRMRAHAEAVLLSHGVTRRIICEVSNCIAMPSLITTTDLIAVLPGPFARNAARHYDLQILPLPFPSVAQRLQIATLGDKTKDSGIEWLSQQLHQAAKHSAVEEHWLAPE
ncbi:LysR substrate-binding domain-containing protein [Ciceribacter sp. L1K22]|uniref:LysR substrate-binding domain-containing protein n=1 Tax=Ciceribacter sp. L1K22 TaxID=2820275 RepID=UPI001ABE4ED7|nr:LysR substrate-binding domain-containing protein [Ciceribacter sp. L1K22]MBO3762577.1 LysR family transcriptional regulator [Ciceribacter sp. L1K22]